MMGECRNISNFGISLFNFGISIVGLWAAPGKMFEVMPF